MKIISKYKDFYDYLVQDNDADIVYVRQAEVIKETYEKLIEPKDVGKITAWWDYLPSITCNTPDGKTQLDNYVFGIYPYVYSQPAVHVKYVNTTNSNPMSLNLVMNKSLADGIVDNYKYGMIELNKAIWNELEKIENCRKETIKLTWNEFEFSKGLFKLIWRNENKEIFEKINAPVFVKYYNELFKDGVYSSIIEKEKLGSVHYVKNISFQKLNLNILKYWYDQLMDLNTYNDIENFLWSVKQEPIANPDNKTKIINHGFDLKTSFRNM